MINREHIQKLIAAAQDVRRSAYAPYSGFTVGAALLCADGSVYTGVNVENASFPAGLCAERTAFAKAVSEGQRQFAAIAIVGAPKEKQPQEFCFPCGVCRQVMAELAGEKLTVIAARSAQDYRLFAMKELLPFAFGAEQLSSSAEGERI